METKETINNNSQFHTIEWTYWDKEIKLNTFRVENNSNVVINIHGTFWSLKWWNDKYLKFAESLQEEQISNTVLYSSSRLNAEIDPNITDRYKQKQARFIGKTFSMELEDARRVIKDTIENSELLFWVKKETLKITLNWNSLGWILAFYLASEFPQVENIVSVWTGLRLDIKDVPILDTFPDISELWPKISNFKWKYLMNYGTEDDVFTEQSFFDLINLVWSSQENKSSVFLVWVDHTFWKIWWEESELPYKKVLSWTKSLLKEWILVSWGDNMYSSKILDQQENVKSGVNNILWQNNGTPISSNEAYDELFWK